MISYNGKLIRQELSSINVLNRAFLFGDGLFESIIYSSGTIPLYGFHWERLNEGIDGLELEVSFSKQVLYDQIIQTVEAQKVSSNAFRIKVMLWRSGGGKYTPESNLSDYFITAEPTKITPYFTINKCELASTVKLHPHTYSHLKTISALSYVLAAKEKQKRNLEELIIQSHDGQLAEATSANIFIYDHHKKEYQTPPLSSGCINGVMRRAIIQHLSQENKSVIVAPIFMESLTNHHSLLLTNVTGIRIVASLEGISLNTDECIAMKLQQVAAY